MSNYTDCIQQNCTYCGGCGCNQCNDLPIANVPTRARVAANTTLLGTDSYGYTVQQIEQYLALSQTDATMAKFSISTNTGALTATLTTNNVFACTDTSTARTLEISTATISQGSVSRPIYITVKDESGNAATNNITISTENLELIDGVASIDITANYGNLTMYSDGVNLYIVSP